VIRKAGRRLFDRLEGALAPAAPRHAALAAAAAAGLGRLRHRLSGRWPTVAEVRLLFPELPARVARGVAARIAGLEARNRLLVASLHRAGLAPIRALVRTHEVFAALRPPMVLVTFHVGAWNGIGPALERLGRPVLVLRDGFLYTPAPPVEIAETGGDEQRRAAAFYRALEVLERGGFVLASLDLPASPGIRAPCLGRSLELARGPLALARLGGAAMAPIAACWCRGGIEIRAGAPLVVRSTPSPSPRGEAAPGTDPGAWEARLAAAAADWLDRYLSAAPEELGLGLLRELLRSPPAGR